MIKCLICNKEYNNIHGLSLHIIQFHNIKTKDYYDQYMKKNSESICLECGKKTRFLSMGTGYSKFCSHKCASNNNLCKEKQKQTCLEKYGVENPFQAEEIKQKIKQTCLKKYGVENPNYSKKIKDKIKKTNLERYGVEYPFQAEELKQKIKQTCLKKYGVETYTYSDDYKEKIKNTCLEKYGVENYSQTDEYKEKVKNTCLEKYKVKYYTQSDEYKKIKKEKTIAKYKYEFPNLNIIDYNENKNIMICYCDICKQNYIIGIMLLGSRLRHLKFKNPCTNCFPINAQYSIQEKELLDYIKSIYKGEIIENNRNILNGKELDIYLPEKKIAFEYNGLYWHSDENKPEQYHLIKTFECDNQNIQLVHIFENDWNENKEKMKCYIKDLIYNNIDMNNYNLIFKKKQNKIIVDRKFNNGKILEQYNYTLNKIIDPQKRNIIFNSEKYNIHDCGYLIYEKEN